jgi:hypothetical protein
MCERHPPGSDVLIGDLENQMKQDEVIITAVADRHRTALFESARTEASTQALLDAMEENSRIQHEILENLHTQREQMWSEKENARQRMKQRNLIEAEVAGDMSKRSENKLLAKDEGNNQKARLREQQNRSVSDSLAKWDKLWKSINERTGIADPQVFFEKFYNRETLEKQMDDMKQVSEATLAKLKVVHQDAEAQREQVRYETFAMHGSSREARDLDTKVTVAAQHLKRSREIHTATDALLHSVTAGVAHIGEIIGIHKAKGQHQTTQEVLELLEQLLTELLDDDDDVPKDAATTGGKGMDGKKGSADGDGVSIFAAGAGSVRLPPHFEAADNLSVSGSDDEGDAAQNGKGSFPDRGAVKGLSKKRTQHGQAALKRAAIAGQPKIEN